MSEPAWMRLGKIREAKAERLGFMWTWMRVQFFRFWTALVVLGAYGYFWLNTPEYLTWWKRTVNTLIEKGCDISTDWSIPSSRDLVDPEEWANALDQKEHKA